MALIRIIIDLADALGLEVQAEGIEETEQHRILTALGCRRSQGFLFSKPLPPAAFEQFAAQRAADLTQVVALPTADVEQAS